MLNSRLLFVRPSACGGIASEFVLRIPEMAAPAIRSAPKTLTMAKTPRHHLALEFSGADIRIDDIVRIDYGATLHTYRLAGVVYYRQTEQHFVSKIVTRDNQMWFYQEVLDRSITAVDLTRGGYYLPPQIRKSGRGGNANCHHCLPPTSVPAHPVAPCALLLLRAERSTSATNSV